MNSSLTVSGPPPLAGDALSDLGYGPNQMSPPNQMSKYEPNGGLVGTGFYTRVRQPEYQRERANLYLNKIGNTYQSRVGDKTCIKLVIEYLIEDEDGFAELLKAETLKNDSFSDRLFKTKTPLGQVLQEYIQTLELGITAPGRPISTQLSAKIFEHARIEAGKLLTKYHNRSNTTVAKDNNPDLEGFAEFWGMLEKQSLTNGQIIPTSARASQDQNQGGLSGGSVPKLSGNNDPDTERHLSLEADIEGIGDIIEIIGEIIKHSLQWPWWYLETGVILGIVNSCILSDKYSPCVVCPCSILFWPLYFIIALMHCCDGSEVEEDDHDARANRRSRCDCGIFQGCY